MRAKAISCVPMYQAIRFERGVRVHPSWFVLFGYYTDITVPTHVDTVPEQVMKAMGEDIWEDSIPEFDMPTWENNDYGSAFVNNLGIYVCMNVCRSRGICARKTQGQRYISPFHEVPNYPIRQGQGSRGICAGSVFCQGLWLAYIRCNSLQGWRAAVAGACNGLIES